MCANKKEADETEITRRRGMKVHSEFTVLTACDKTPK